MAGGRRNVWDPLSRALGRPVRSVGALMRPTVASTSERSSPLSGLVDVALYRDGRRAEPVSSLSAAFDEARSSSSHFVWLGLHEPSATEFDEVASLFDLHPLAVEDAIHAHQRSKIEVYGDSLFAVLKTARYVDDHEVIDIGEIMLFIGRNFVVTVRHGAASALAAVRRELEDRPDVLAVGPSAVLWAVADRVVDDYENALIGLAEDIEQIEAAVFDPRVDSPTERIYRLKREVIEFRRAIEPLGPALGHVVDRPVTLIDERTHPYFRDVHDHALRAGSRLVGFDELLSGVLDANVALATLRQNEDMRKITAWAAILASVTAIAGIYGMNFEHMPELHWAHGYYLSLGGMAGLSVGLYILFRRRHWL